jgi:hypothetical protein
MRNFIKARLNKDNFWNLMFFLGMFIGISIAFATDTMILSWITIIGVIWLVKRNSDITFNKDKLEFVINGNKKIKTSGAEFILLMFASFGVMAMVGFILDSLKIDDSSILLAMMISLLIFLPTLYCILRNLPIAMYFKKETWITERSEPYNSSDNSRHFSTSSDSKITCMSYDYLPGNMYYGSYLDRHHK